MSSSFKTEISRKNAPNVIIGIPRTNECDCIKTYIDRKNLNMNIRISKIKIKFDAPGKKRNITTSQKVRNNLQKQWYIPDMSTI